MLYTKPKGLKYTDMCIFVDKVVKEGNPTEDEINLVFEYLYHLSFMLAHKHKYFNESHYYEEFAIYFATEILHRLFYNPKLEQVDENGDPVLKPIKSVLNYMKSIIYGRKCAFENMSYSQKITAASSDYNYDSNIATKLKDSLIYNIESGVDIYLNTFSKEVKHLVQTSSPYKNDKQLLKNIYISCLLSVINSITFTEAELKSIEDTYTLPKSKYKYINRLYKRNRENCVVLYNLSESYRDYITVLVRRIFKQLREDLIMMSKDEMEITDDILSELIYLELDGTLNLY